MTNQNEEVTTKPANAREPVQRRSSEAKGGDGGAAEVQATMDEATDKGYFGYSPDPTPRENYGAQHNDAPTPETDEEMNLAARKAAGLK